MSLDKYITCDQSYQKKTYKSGNWETLSAHNFWFAIVDRDQIFKLKEFVQHLKKGKLVKMIDFTSYISLKYIWIRTCVLKTHSIKKISFNLVFSVRRGKFYEVSLIYWFKNIVNFKTVNLSICHHFETHEPSQLRFRHWCLLYSQTIKWP